MVLKPSVVVPCAKEMSVWLDYVVADKKTALILIALQSCVVEHVTEQVFVFFENKLYSI